jgi:hypothetical protein
MVINGKNAGFATAPAGSKLEIITREESKIKVKYRNFEPVWINSSDAAEENKTPADSATTEQPQTVAFDPQKALEAMESNSMEALTSMMHGQKYPDPDRQGDLEDAVSAFVKAKAEISTAKKQKLDSEGEIKRLKRNAEVAGRPNRLNPNDTSGQERAQKIRDEADTLEKESASKIAHAEENLETTRTTLARFLKSWGDEHNRMKEQTAIAEKQKDHGNNPKADDSENEITKTSTPESAIEVNNKKQDKIILFRWVPIFKRLFGDDARSLFDWTRDILQESGLMQTEVRTLMDGIFDMLIFYPSIDFQGEKGRVFYKEFLLSDYYMRLNESHIPTDYNFEARSEIIKENRSYQNDPQFNGFYIGMSIADFEEAIKSFYPEAEFQYKILNKDLIQLQLKSSKDNPRAYGIFYGEYKNAVYLNFLSDFGNLVIGKSTDKGLNAIKNGDDSNETFGLGMNMNELCFLFMDTLDLSSVKVSDHSAKYSHGELWNIDIDRVGFRFMDLAPQTWPERFGNR